MIYEGTNGIQALDLVGRKLPAHGGRAIMTWFGEIDAFVAENGGDRAFGIIASVDVQIRAADAAGVNGNNNLFLSACSGVRDFGIDHLLGPEGVQRFHRVCVVLSQWNVMVRPFR